MQLMSHYKVEGKSLRMEVDSGACRSVIHRSQFYKNFKELSLSKVNFKLNVVPGEEVKILGQALVHVKLKDLQFNLPYAYDMPFALKDKVEDELNSMLKSGIIEKVSYSNWASPIVIVPKKNSNQVSIGWCYMS